MRLYKRGACLSMFFLTCVASAGLALTSEANGIGAMPRGEVVQANSVAVQFITAEELKSKLTKNEPVAIIDVRGSTGVLENDNKIKGAVYVKLRRLKSRLNIPPLRDVPRDREVVTYCACPNDESSIRAAQMLLESGFKRVRVLKGGWVTWKQAKGPVEPMSKVM